LKSKCVNYKSLSNIMQGIMFANITDETLLKQTTKSFSEMKYFAPARHYSTFKQFRLHTAHLFADWNFHFYDNRIYHAASEFIPFRSMKSVKDEY
jgi:hypothetical protein